MKVTQLSEVQPRARHIAVGTFDGVHRGHREVIQGAETVVTFDPHPQSVIAPHTQPRLLTTLARKTQLIAALGVQELVVIPLNDQLALRSPDEFIDHVIVERVGATRVNVGENFRFGHHAGGDVRMLAADARFATRLVPLLEVDGEVVSSSHIRGLVSGGAVEYAGELLGDPFAIDGVVAHGDKRGRTLGFPTANLVPEPGYVLPGHGVYASRVGLPDGSFVTAATNVGVRPQFETGRGELVEAFLIDWSGDIYGQPIRIEFLRRLRGERRFESVEALVAQMERDVDDARAFVAD